MAWDWGGSRALISDCRDHYRDLVDSAEGVRGGGGGSGSRSPFFHSRLQLRNIQQLARRVVQVRVYQRVRVRTSRCRQRIESARAHTSAKAAASAQHRHNAAEVARAARALLTCASEVWRAVRQGRWEHAAAVALGRPQLLAMVGQPVELFTQDDNLVAALTTAVEAALRCAASDADTVFFADHARTHSGAAIKRDEAVSAVTAVVQLTGAASSARPALWLDARARALRACATFHSAVAAVDGAVEVASLLGADGAQVDAFLGAARDTAATAAWPVDSVSEASTLLGQLSDAARTALAQPLQAARDAAVVSNLAARLRVCADAAAAKDALAAWRAECGAAATNKLAAAPLERMAAQWAQPFVARWDLERPDAASCLSAALALHALQRVAPLMLTAPLGIARAECWWAGWAVAVGRQAQWPSLWGGVVWPLLSALAAGGPRVPPWVPPLIALEAGHHLSSGGSLEAVTRFSPTLHSQLLLLSSVLGTATCHATAVEACRAMGLPDRTPLDRGAPGRPFLRRAAQLLEAADPIDAAYAQLHAPGQARATLGAMALLLSPLTGAAPSLGTAALASAEEEPICAPVRPALRLLPHARPRVHAGAGAQAGDDDDETLVPLSDRPSLLQRLGSQLW